MKPIDPRLLKYAAPMRRVLALGSFLALLKTVSVIAWTFSVANLIVLVAAPLMRFETETPGLALQGMGELFTPTGWFIVAVSSLILRVIIGWAIEMLSATGGVKVKTKLRELALENIKRLGPNWLSQKSGVDVTLRLTRGLDALDRYFSQFMPQLILTAVTTPVLVLVLLWADLLSGIIVIIVLPLMPIFMILIGIATKGAQDKQWRALRALSAAYMSVLGGIETLKIFRLEKMQVRRVREITEDYRSRTMKVLRMTFISGFVLDLGATLSVAIVAVTVGTRLVDGAFPLITGLFILLLLPETFVALRNVGAAFHASGEGVSAAEDIFEIIEAVPETTISVADPAQPGPRASSISPVSSAPTLADPAPPAPSLDDPATLAFNHADAAQSPLLAVENLVLTRGTTRLNEAVSFEVLPGEIVAVTGESGVGKSTMLLASMGKTSAGGHITRAPNFVYVKQRQRLPAGSILDTVALGDTEPDVSLAQSILRELGLKLATSAVPNLESFSKSTVSSPDAFSKSTVSSSGSFPKSTVNKVSENFDFTLDTDGRNVSGGQAQRIALARALYFADKNSAPLLLLDEPTSQVDQQSTELIFAALKRRAKEGYGVLIVTHSRWLAGQADKTLHMRASENVSEVS